LTYTRNDEQRWEKQGRDDILYYAEAGDLWIGEHDELSRCPFLHKEFGCDKYKCLIHNTKPDVCRKYSPGKGCNDYKGHWKQERFPEITKVEARILQLEKEGKLPKFKWVHNSDFAVDYELIHKVRMKIPEDQFGTPCKLKVRGSSKYWYYYIQVCYSCVAEYEFESYIFEYISEREKRERPWRDDCNVDCCFNLVDIGLLVREDKLISEELYHD
jgi:hypothetical protein